MTLGKNDWKKLDRHFESVDKRFEKQHKKIASDVKKLLLAQDIRNWGKMDKLEEKFEKKVIDLKSDFVEEIDPIINEVTTAREERPLIVEKQSNHETRIEALEKVHPKGKHLTTIA
jgi:hypothetical protein